MSRTAIVVWLFVVSHMDSWAEELQSFQYMNVSVGQDVMLPCPCSEDTDNLVWQIGEEIVVNHCCKTKDPLHESYVNRTQVFMSSTKGNCSLRLHNVSLDDKKNFTCYIFNRQELTMHTVGLKVEAGQKKDVDTTKTIIQNPPMNRSAAHTGFLVGIPLSFMLVILVGLIVLHIRKHWQRRPRMVVVQDPQAKLAIMNHSPV